MDDLNRESRPQGTFLAAATYWDPAKIKFLVVTMRTVTSNIKRNNTPKNYVQNYVLNYASEHQYLQLCVHPGTYLVARVMKKTY